MPRKVTAYACIHGCRRRVVTSRASAEEHETRCYKNEDRRTCATCAHDFMETPAYTPGMTPEQLRAMTVKGCREGRRDVGGKLVYDCPYWEPKSDEPWDDEPAWEI